MKDLTFDLSFLSCIFRFFESLCGARQKARPIFYCLAAAVAAGVAAIVVAAAVAATAAAVAQHKAVAAAKAAEQDDEDDDHPDVTAATSIAIHKITSK